MLTAAGGISHGASEGRHAPVAGPKGRPLALAALSTPRSGAFDAGERTTRLLGTRKLRYSVASSGRMGRPSGKCGVKLRPSLQRDPRPGRPPRRHASGQPSDCNQLDPCRDSAASSGDGRRKRDRLTYRVDGHGLGPDHFQGPSDLVLPLASPESSANSGAAPSSPKEPPHDRFIQGHFCPDGQLT